MQDRWVTYIYRYHEQVRGENVGFIKVQKISTQAKESARFQIGIKLYKTKACKCTIHLVDGENIYKIKEIFLSAQEQDTMMLRFEIPWWSPVGADKVIADYAGLYFVCDDGERCGGFWHERYEPIEYTQVIGVTENKDRFVPASEVKEWKPKKLTQEVAASDYKAMLDTYPKLPLFTNSRLVNCVKIMPQDIGKLPIGNWKLGTNSFVTHGFYHYQYLMLGNVILEQGERLVIGIPGVFTNKEKYVANMFGFARFVPAQQCDYMTGRFGYWISEVVSE